MKHCIIVALVCLNAALLVALVFGATTEKAYGQVLGANYLVVTGAINDDYELVYVLDLGTRRLAAWRFDRTKKQMVPIARGGGRNLMEDFSRARDRR